jgi:hypothetical protein
MNQKDNAFHTSSVWNTKGYQDPKNVKAIQTSSKTEGAFAENLGIGDLPRTELQVIRLFSKYCG